MKHWQPPPVSLYSLTVISHIPMEAQLHGKLPGYILMVRLPGTTFAKSQNTMAMSFLQTILLHWTIILKKYSQYPDFNANYQSTLICFKKAAVFRGEVRWINRMCLYLGLFIIAKYLFLFCGYFWNIHKKIDFWENTIFKFSLLFEFFHNRSRLKIRHKVRLVRR